MKIHKYTKDNTTGHVCKIQSYQNNGECCSSRWNKVTCKKCLNKRGKK